MRLLISCEHGGNRIPPHYRPLFKRHRAQLESHRGYDAGALAFARDLAKAYGAELVYSTTSRLLVELNRSPGHPQLMSEATRDLTREERERLLERYYWPYRNSVEARVKTALGSGQRVLHISCHSFTPRLDGVVRRADVGLLYDPRRASELAFCRAWQKEIRTADPALVVRRNYPYRGWADGLTTHLRQLHPDARYAGVEIEINQKHVKNDTAQWRDLRTLLVTTLRPLLHEAKRSTPRAR